MPTNKNALLRYQILDRCFSNRHRKYTIEDLVDAVNEALYDMYGSEVSMRQIRDDIKYMRDRVSYNAPIEAVPFDGKRCYYHYSDPNFTIFNSELSTEEVAKLCSTIKMLGRYRGGANRWLEEVISNLELRFGVKGKTENVVSFEQNEQLKGLEFLDELIDSAINHQPLRILYVSYYGIEHDTIVHPYHIKQFNNRWFLLGLEETTDHGNRLTNKALDRIVKFSRADVAFIPNTDIDFSEYFKDIVGVTVPKEHPVAEKVLLRFDPARFPYIVSKPIHPSQEVISKEEHTLQITVRPNKELEAQLFSYGPQVEVLEPQWLRQQIEEKIEKTLKNYSTGKKDCTIEQ